MWGINAKSQQAKYLGLSAIIGKSRHHAFGEVKSWLWKKLQCWKKKLLSQEGKEVLLKAFSLALPTYTLSCFKLSGGLCTELENLMA